MSLESVLNKERLIGLEGPRATPPLDLEIEEAFTKIIEKLG